MVHVRPLHATAGIAGDLAAPDLAGVRVAVHGHPELALPQDVQLVLACGEELRIGAIFRCAWREHGGGAIPALLLRLEPVARVGDHEIQVVLVFRDLHPVDVFVVRVIELADEGLDLVIHACPLFHAGNFQHADAARGEVLLDIGKGVGDFRARDR